MVERVGFYWDACPKRDGSDRDSESVGFGDESWGGNLSPNPRLIFEFLGKDE